jgi:hypothetical protein
MRGLGASLPKGTAMFVPFNCDVVLGDSVNDFANAAEFVEVMQDQYRQLNEQCIVQIE